jgi:hypothetical protein
MAVAPKAAGAGAGTEVNAAALSLPCPAAVDVNDILIAHVIWLDLTSAPATPGSWTPLYGPANLGTAAVGRAWVFGKLAAGTEDGATIGFGTAGGTAGRYGRIYSFGGYVSGTLVQIIPADSFTDIPHATDPQAPTVTTTVAGACAVALVAQNDNNTIGDFTGEAGGDWVEAFAEYVDAAIGTQGCMAQLQTAIPTADPGTISGGTVNTQNDPTSVIGFQIAPTAPAIAVGAAPADVNAGGQPASLALTALQVTAVPAAVDVAAEPTAVLGPTTVAAAPASVTVDGQPTVVMVTPIFIAAAEAAVAVAVQVVQSAGPETVVAAPAFVAVAAGGAPPALAAAAIPAASASAAVAIFGAALTLDPLAVVAAPAAVSVAAEATPFATPILGATYGRVRPDLTFGRT